jgi:hypothetical protein
MQGQRQSAFGGQISTASRAARELLVRSGCVTGFLCIRFALSWSPEGSPLENHYVRRARTRRNSAAQNRGSRSLRRDGRCDLVLRHTHQAGRYLNLLLKIIAQSQSCGRRFFKCRRLASNTDRWQRLSASLQSHVILEGPATQRAAVLIELTFPLRGRLRSSRPRYP